MSILPDVIRPLRMSISRHCMPASSSSIPPAVIRPLRMFIPPDCIRPLRRPLCRMSSGLGLFTCGAPSLFSSLRFFYPLCSPSQICLFRHKVAYFSKKIPISLAYSVFLLYLCTVLPYRNDGQATVKRRSSDSQSQRNLPVKPKTSPNLCIILYYIFIYNIP